MSEQLVIEIMDVNNSHIPTPRTIKGQNGKPDRVIYDQIAFAHVGDVFPIRTKLTHNDHKDALPVGKYTIHPSSFKVGRFGSLELDTFNLVLVPQSDFADKK